MNDPGTAEPMDQVDQEVQRHLEQGDMMNDEEIENFLDPR
jgi:hypothetical protein